MLPLLQATLSSRNYLRGEKFSPDQFGYNTTSMARSSRPEGSYTSEDAHAMG